MLIQTWSYIHSVHCVTAEMLCMMEKYLKYARINLKSEKLGKLVKAEHPMMYMMWYEKNKNNINTSPKFLITLCKRKHCKQSHWNACRKEPIVVKIILWGNQLVTIVSFSSFSSVSSQFRLLQCPSFALQLQNSMLRSRHQRPDAKTWAPSTSPHPAWLSPDAD